MKQRSAELAVPKDERSDDASRKREKRSEAARIEIDWSTVDWPRREACLADPERFLRTYLDYRFTRNFYPHQLRMIEGIYERAKYGGSKSYAAPRGDGKTEICTGMLVYVMLACLVDYTVPIAATTKLASDIFKDFKYHFENSETLGEDFPEVCQPVKALQGAPQRAGKQHVDGTLTRIEWSKEQLVFPNVPDSPYGGYCMSYYGLDAAIRGVRIRGKRPKLVLVDDPETRESAKSDHQIREREQMLDRDVAGLGGQEGNVSVVAITTCQNRKSLSWRLTGEDKGGIKIKPAYEGERFAAIAKWPDNGELWDDYIAQRKVDQNEGDPYGSRATELYLAKRKEMDAGAEVINPGRFDRRPRPDGQPREHSNLQHCYNFISDHGLPAFLAEYQNEPEPEAEVEGVGITAGMVMSRTEPRPRAEVPDETEVITVGLDIGKYASHWSKIAWRGNAVGSVVDYGVMETHGLTVQSSPQAIERALLASLHAWSEEITQAGEPLLVLVDSGDYTEVIYEFCRSAGQPFFPCKGYEGWSFRTPEASKTKQPFEAAYASWLEHASIWLYNLDSWHWKNWTHERFVTDAYTDDQRNDGSLALWQPQSNKEHMGFAKHITAEELQVTFEPGKGERRRWAPLSRNNHWLDATAYACCAAGAVGMRLVARETQSVSERVKTIEDRKPAMSGLHGRKFVATQRG